MELTKICLKCKENKRVDDFHKCAGRKGGFGAMCKTCVAEYAKSKGKDYRKGIYLKKKAKCMVLIMI